MVDAHGVNVHQRVDDTAQHLRRLRLAEAHVVADQLVGNVAAGQVLELDPHRAVREPEARATDAHNIRMRAAQQQRNFAQPHALALQSFSRKTHRFDNHALGTAARHRPRFIHKAFTVRCE